MLSTPEPLQVLIVEDSPDDAELMQIALARGGLAYAARRVEALADFLLQLEAAPPDVVLCDFHLPRFSCDAVLEALADRRLDIPVIVVSRHISPQEAEAMLALGARACVMKNRMGQLAATVQRVLKGPCSR